jgi:membrane protein
MLGMRRRAAHASLVLRRSLDSMLQTGGTRDAAQVAFFLVLSFPALLLLVVWAFSTLLGDDSVRASIVDAIVSILPLEEGAARSDVEQLLDEVAAGAGALGWIGVLTLIYSSSGAIGGLRHAVNEAWGEHETRPFVPAKALDVGLTLVVAPLSIVALGLTLSGSLADTIGDHPWIVGAGQFAVTRVLPLAIFFGLLVLLFRILPEEPGGLRAAWPGALVALGGLAVRFGLTLWFSVFGDASAVYGTIGALLAAVLSAYLVAIAIVFGAHVSSQVARLPDAAAMDRAVEQASGGRTLGELVRGLFVREPR